jgi:NTP pyrophosphatase (non-canonical NTP hydrolase)
MTPTDYHRLAARTRMDLPPREALAYAGLKLSGEAGEVLATIFSDGPNSRAEKIAELGDVCWYIAMIADTLGLDADQLWTTYEPILALTWYNATIRLMLAAAATSEATGKGWHGKGHALILPPLSRTVAAVHACASILGIDVEDVWAANVEKLRARWPDGFKVSQES